VLLRSIDHASCRSLIATVLHLLFRDYVVDNILFCLSICTSAHDISREIVDIDFIKTFL